MTEHGPVPEPDAGHLDLVMDAAGGGWVDWGVPHDRLVCDERMCRLFGLDPGTFDQRPASFWVVVHPVDRPGVESAVAAALAACSDYSAEYRAVLPDGDVRWV